jgi:hypothetical protein
MLRLRNQDIVDLLTGTLALMGSSKSGGRMLFVSARSACRLAGTPAAELLCLVGSDLPFPLPFTGRAPVDLTEGGRAKGRQELDRGVEVLEPAHA